MKFKGKSIARVIGILAMTIAIIGCEREFATLDSDIINDNSATNFDTTSETYDVIAYTNALGPVQTNGFGLNQLGIYQDGIYGKTKASVVTQLQLSTPDPDFSNFVELDSVILTIPYFSNNTGFNEATSRNEYELDSVFSTGSSFSPFKLSLYENSYALRDFDPNADFDTPQAFFSNKTASATEIISEASLRSRPIEYSYYNEDGTANNTGIFQISAQEILLTSPDDDTDEDSDPQLLFRLTPAVRLVLNNDFWQELIINEADRNPSTFSNQNNFSDYFKGIYFDIEEEGAENTLALLDFASDNANIRLYYKRDIQDIEGEITGTEQAEYVLNFGPNGVNFFENDFNVFLPVDGDPVDGDERLYLKGGEGAIAGITLFNGETNDDDQTTDNNFETWRKEFVVLDDEGNFESAKRLVNDAFLTFYVDQDMVSGVEPNRIYIYDKRNERPLVDYQQDVINNTLPEESIISHLGPLEKDSEGNGIKYRIRITSHINDLLLNNTDNVELGLAVSGNVNLEGSLSQRAVQTPDDSEETVPISSLVTPRGTILHGNLSEVESKRVKLEIFYSCINTDENCLDN